MCSFEEDNSDTIQCENVRVVIRVRPLTEKELEDDIQDIVQIHEEDTIISLSKPNSNRTTSTSFRFDRIFYQNSTQLQVYKHVAYPIIDKVLQGYNGTIFAYGQTGTGKTYTMMGDEHDSNQQGVIPNAFSHIFGQIARYGGEKSFVVTATFLEIYNESVRDLLSKNRDLKLEVRERSDIGVYVKGLIGYTIDSIESIRELMKLGNKNRMTKSTLMNKVSSRSHAIFTITAEAKDKNDNKITVGKLNLVDLAGSERLQKTQACGDRLKEATNINQSLSVLGSVISALVDGRSTHVPYRNSKLTRLLQDSLGGNSKTAMIAAISPSECDFEESICTLRYASRVKYIKNQLKINIETKRGLIESFEEEIERLRERLSFLVVSEQRQRPKFPRSKSRTSLDVDKTYDEEMLKVEEEKMELTRKISLIQKKILVGGENLLEKAQHQLSLLEISDIELEILNRSHQGLEGQIQQKEIEKLNVTEQYSNLQDENSALTEKIRIIQTFLSKSRLEYANKQQDHSNEIDILYFNHRALTKESQLADFIVQNVVPKSYISQIQANVTWNTEIDEFQFRGLQYAGNNLRNTDELKNRRRENSQRTLGTRVGTSVYGAYKQKHGSKET